MTDRPVDVRERPVAGLRLRVLTPEGGPASAARVELRNAAGEGLVPSAGLVFDLRRRFGDETHAVVPGSCHLDVPAGRVSIRVERGPEFVAVASSIDLEPGEEVTLELQPRRIVEMERLGWLAADLHGHRPSDELPRLMDAEQLAVATSIATHNGRPQFGDLPAGVWSRPTGPGRWASIGDVELERLEEGTGAVVGLAGAFDGTAATSGVSTWGPTEFVVARAIREQRGHVHAEKPFWRCTPALAALGLVDSLGVVNNHVGPTWSYPELAPLGGHEPAAGLCNGDALVAWMVTLYDRFLDAGCRLPAAAGSASGWMPAPLGFARTYVRTGGDRTPAGFYAALRRGESFATNGPLVLLEVAGHGPGTTLADPQDRRVPVTVTAAAGHPLHRAELVRDGEVVAEVTGDGSGALATLEIETDPRVGGWLSARAYGSDRGSPRYAVTSPVWLGGGRPSAREQEARGALVRWLGDTIVHLGRVGAPAELIAGYERARDAVRSGPRGTGGGHRSCAVPPASRQRTRTP